MSFAQEYKEKLDELTRPSKKDFVTYDVMNFKTGQFLHRKLKEATLVEGGYERPLRSSTTKEQGDLLVIRRDDWESNYMEAVKSYNDRHKKIMDDFKKALFEDAGVDEELGNVIYSKAWEEGHHGGLSEVELHFFDFEEFAQKVIETKLK